MKEYGFHGFCIVYFPHYLYEEPADFFIELLAALSDPSIPFLEVIGFRGSAKSTFASLALPIYAALELPDDYPFIIPIADTSTQAGINIANIKNELENNQLLLRDYGRLPTKKRVKDPSPEPTLESEEEWQAKNMLLSNKVRILARSRGQKIRGLRHQQWRPRLVICDDLEDLKYVRFKENRDETEKWLRGEVMPAMDTKRRKLVVIGNFLHSDAIMARIKKWGTFTVIELPLITADGFVTWPALYPDQQSLDAKRKELGEVSWQREMLLKVVPEEGQDVKPDDITYYSQLPNGRRGLRGHGVDFAISQKASADYTTIVTGKVYYDEKAGRPKIYIMPKPICDHLTFHETINTLTAIPLPGEADIFFPEDVGYQKAAIQEMVRAGLTVQPMKSITDKRSRLRVASIHIKNGTVLFPITGCEDLLAQLFGFGVEQHDDLVDGLVNLILGLIEVGLELPQVWTV